MKQCDADENRHQRIEGGKSYDCRSTSLFESGEKGEESDEGEESSEGRPGAARGIPLDFKSFHKQNDYGEGKHSYGLKQERLAGLGVIGGELAEDSPESPGDDGHDGVEIPGLQKTLREPIAKRIRVL